MSFLMITYEFPPSIGGVETRALNYVSNLTKMGYEVVVVALSPSNKCIFIEKLYGATIYRCPTSYMSTLKVFFSVLKAVKNSSPIKMLQILTGANTPLGILFLAYGKIKNVKTGIFLYGKDILTSKKNPLRLLLLNIALFLTDKIGVNSKATSELLSALPLKKVYILYPGINVDELSRCRVSKKRKERELLFVGRLVERKAVDNLLRAFKLVFQRVSNTKLVIVGDGPQRNHLTSLAEKLGIRENVEFTGALHGKDLYERYQNCDVFVMPSKKLPGDVEGFGIVFLEAGFFGKPSVGTWSGGIPEAVIHNKTGILVPEGDIVALKNAIELLFTDKSLGKKLGDNAHKRVVRDFTWEKATEKLLKMYMNDETAIKRSII